ncbi:MAG: hypothetical protein KF685_08995 [Acidobacteria bacterium]|nr:hypothetical protein [Acidobacteriota bacterium]
MNDTFNDRLSEAKRKLWEKLTMEERLLITDQFFMTAKDIIIDNAPKHLSENQLKRYVYEKMYHEPPPKGLWE